MQITVEKLTDYTLLKRAAWATSGKNVKAPLEAWYECEHSPMRTQIFWVEMHDIPSYVHVHFRTHSVGITHFVRSNREDRGGDPKADRYTPVVHCMLLNAQSLVNLARKRMCLKADKITQFVMNEIAEGVLTVDPDLHKMLVPDCVYRNKCHEVFGTCGYFDGMQKKD